MEKICNFVKFHVYAHLIKNSPLGTLLTIRYFKLQALFDECILHAEKNKLFNIY